MSEKYKITEENIEEVVKRLLAPEQANDARWNMENSILRCIISKMAKEAGGSLTFNGPEMMGYMESGLQFYMPMESEDFTITYLNEETLKAMQEARDQDKH